MACAFGGSQAQVALFGWLKKEAKKEPSRLRGVLSVTHLARVAPEDQKFLDRIKTSPPP